MDVAATVLWVRFEFTYLVADWLCGEMAAAVRVVEKCLGWDCTARRALLDVD